MSHTVTVKTEVKDREAINAACDRCNIKQPIEGTHRMFDGRVVKGLAVELPGWNYPAVIEEATGEIAYDNYKGMWGDQLELDKFLQGYTLEVASRQAIANGYAVTEEPLEDGLVRLTMESY